MDGKKDYTRFNIKLSKTDPNHIRAAQILNRQGERSKAKYIVNAVLHYESCGKSPDAGLHSQFNEKIIEIVMSRVLRESSSGGFDMPLVPSARPQMEIAPQPAEEILLNADAERLDTDGLGAIVGALDMFRAK
jgi:hypothetical protein